MLFIDFVEHILQRKLLLYEKIILTKMYNENIKASMLIPNRSYGNVSQFVCFDEITIDKKE